MKKIDSKIKKCKNVLMFPSEFRKKSWEVGSKRASFGKDLTTSQPPPSSVAAWIIFVKKQDENVRHGLREWLSDDDSNTLDGFSWRRGCERETSGILLWSEPFLATMPTGEKVKQFQKQKLSSKMIFVPGGYFINGYSRCSRYTVNGKR